MYNQKLLLSRADSQVRGENYARARKNLSVDITRDFPTRIKEVEVTKTQNLFALQCKCLQFTSYVEDPKRRVEWEKRLTFFPFPLLMNLSKQCPVTVKFLDDDDDDDHRLFCHRYLRALLLIAKGRDNGQTDTRN